MHILYPCSHTHSLPLTLLLELFDRQLYKQEMTTINISWKRGQSHPFSQVMDTGTAPCCRSKFNQINSEAEEEGWICDRNWLHLTPFWWKEEGINFSATDSEMIILNNYHTFSFIAFRLMMNSASVWALLVLIKTHAPKRQRQKRRGTPNRCKASCHIGLVLI